MNNDKEKLYMPRHYGLDDKFFTPVELTDDLARQLRTVTPTGERLVSSDVTAFKRKLLEFGNIAASMVNYPGELVGRIPSKEHPDSRVIANDLETIQITLTGSTCRDRGATGDVHLGFHEVNDLAFVLCAGSDLRKATKFFAIYLGVDGKMHGYAPFGDDYRSLLTNIVENLVVVESTIDEQLNSYEVVFTSPYDKVPKLSTDDALPLTKRWVRSERSLFGHAYVVMAEYDESTVTSFGQVLNVSCDDIVTAWHQVSGYDETVFPSHGVDSLLKIERSNGDVDYVRLSGELLTSGRSSLKVDVDAFTHFKRQRLLWDDRCQVYVIVK